MGLTTVTHFVGSRLESLYPRVRGLTRGFTPASLRDLASGRIRLPELHGYEAQGVGRKSIVGATWTESMKRSAKATPQFAICINNTEYPASLELYKIYRVLPDEDADQDGDLRVIDESGEHYLYPADYFMLVELPSDVQGVLLES